MSTLTQPIKWHGGKHYLAKRIIELMPPHVHYVESYCGYLSKLHSIHAEDHGWHRVDIQIDNKASSKKKKRDQDRMFVAQI